MAKNLVVFGGTFDPVHHGHLIVARSIAEHCGFDCVTFVPAGTPPHKAPAAARAEQRLAMLELAVEGEPRLAVCDIELGRPGPNYTFETLTALRERIGGDVGLHLAVGADMLADLPNWRRAGDVVRMARVLVAHRPSWPERMDEVFRRFREAFGPEAADRLAESVIPVPLIGISSTEVRQRVAAGRSIRFLVPEPVRRYISENRLYAPGSVRASGASSS